MNEPLVMLRGRDLVRHFGGVKAIDGVDFDVREGEIAALIGPNGAGKTTLFNLVTGFVPPSSGTVEWKGEDVTRAKPASLCARGIVRTFQQPRVFAAVSVRENLRIAGQTTVRTSVLGDYLGTPRSRHARRAVDERVDEAVERFGLAPVADRLSEDLAYGVRKRLGLILGWMAQPSLLILDEPAAGLNHEEVDSLKSDLHGFRDDGITLWLVEHHMGLVMTVSDWVMVLDAGRVIAQGPPDTVANDESVVAAYLGVND